MEADRLSGSTVFNVVDAEEGADWMGETVAPQAGGRKTLGRSPVSGRKAAASQGRRRSGARRS
jgi:hypothetical protein